MKIKRYRTLSIEVCNTRGAFIRFMASNKPSVDWSDLSEVEKFATELEQSGDYNEVYIYESRGKDPRGKILRRWNKRHGYY